MHTWLLPYRFLLLLGMAVLFVPAHAQLFSDIDRADIDREVIAEAAMNQLMEGFPDGTFHPEATISRAQGVMVMARLFNVALRGFTIVPAPAPTDPHKTGIPAKHWVYPAAQFLAERGVYNTQIASLPLEAPLSRSEVLTSIAQILHPGAALSAADALYDFSDKCLLPDGWDTQPDTAVTRREMARLLDTTLFYLTQHAVAEGTVTAFETDEFGTRWVHLATPIGEARLVLPERGVVIDGAAAEHVVEGMRVRTLSDAVSSMQGKPYYRVREVTIIQSTAQRT